MRTRGLLIAVALISAALSAQTTGQAPQLPRSQTLDPGRWTFEWDMPDSPLGPAGRVTGTEIYSRGVDGRFFESDYEGEGPQGRFKGHAVIIYNRDAKTIARSRSCQPSAFSLQPSGITQMLLSTLNLCNY